MAHKIRFWQHDGRWRIQFYVGAHPDKHGILQDWWQSHRRNGIVKLFKSEQEAREYMQSGRRIDCE